MNNKGSFKVFLIVVLVIVVLLGILLGAFYFINNGNSPNDINKQTSDGKTNLIDNSNNGIDLSSCSNITDTTKKDLCLMNIAIMNYNLPTCNKLSSEEAITGCYFEFAGQRNEPSVCEREEIKNYVTKDGKNTSGPDFCYLTVVARNYFRDNFTSQDISDNCNKIKESQLREGCLNYIKLKNG